MIVIYITPLFILLDYLGGINVRVAVLDSFPLYKNLYYRFIINLILAGGIAIIAFHGSLRRIEKSATHPELDSD